MTTCVGHLGLALSMVAVLAHVLGVMLSVSVRALVDRSSGSLDSCKFDLNDLVILRLISLLTNRLLRLGFLHVKEVVQMLIVRIFSAQSCCEFSGWSSLCFKRLLLLIESPFGDLLCEPSLLTGNRIWRFINGLELIGWKLL